MASGNVTLRIALTGEDRLAAVIDRADKSIKKFRKNTKDTGSVATRAFAEIKGKVTGVGTQFTELRSKLELLVAGFQAVRGAAEAAVGGEIANNAKTAFTQMAGGAEQAKKAVGSLQDATRGVMAEADLVGFANRMKVAGVSFENISKTLSMASDVSLATGRDLTEVAEQMQDAAITGAEDVFRRLGITANLNEELARQAELEGRVVEEMTTNEQATIRLAALQEKLGDTFAVNGIRLGKFSTNIQEAKTAMDDFAKSVSQMAARQLQADEFEKNTEKLADRIQKMAMENISSFADVREHSEKLAESFERSFGIPAARTKAIIKQQTEGIALMADDTTAKMRLAESLALAADEEAEKRRIARVEKVREANRLETASQKEKLAKIKSNENEVFQLQKDIQKDLQDGEKLSAQLKQKDVEITKVAISLLKGEITAAKAEAKTALIELQAETLVAESDRAAEEKRDQEKTAKRKAFATKRRRQKEQERQKEIEADQAFDLLEIQMAAERFEKLGDLESAQAKRLEMEGQRHKQKMGDLDKKSFNQRRFEQLTHEKNTLEILEEFEEKKLEVKEKAQEAEDALNERRRESLAKWVESQRELTALALDDSIRQANRWGQGLERLMEPISMLNDHQASSSSGMQAFAASAAAASAATNAYANSNVEASSAQERLAKSSPAMIAAGGQAASAMVKDTRKQAAVRGLFESAASVASYAMGDVVGGSMHALSASMFFAMAGMSAGAKTASKGPKKTGAVGGGGGGTGFQTDTKSSAIVVNVQGFAIGSAADMGTQIGAQINDSRETGIDSAEV